MAKLPRKKQRRDCPCSDRGEKLNVPYRRHATLLKLLATVVRGPAVPAVTMKLCTQWGGTTRGGTMCRAEGLGRGIVSTR